MEEILSMDDRIDRLSDFEVKEVYVRYRIMDALMTFYGRRKRGFEDRTFEEGEMALSKYTNDGVRTYTLKVARKGILASWMARVANRNRAEDFIIEMFDRMTVDDRSDDELIESARDRLKFAVKNSCGMPDDRVVRDRVRDLTDEE